MKDLRPEIATPTMEACYQSKSWYRLGDKIFPDYIEKGGGYVTADASPCSIDVGDHPAEDQGKHSVIANLAWVVDSGATFDTVPLGYAKQGDLQRILVLTPLRSTRQTVPLWLSMVWCCNCQECLSMFAPLRCLTRQP